MRLRALSLLILPLLTLPAYADSVTLGSASSFGLLGGTVSNTGTSVVTGNVGATITNTGFPPGTATGFVCPPSCAAGDTTAVTAAYNAVFGTSGAFSTAEGLTSTGTFTGLASQIFVANTSGDTVIASPGTISTVTGINLTFDAGSNPAPIFIIQVPGAFTVNGVMTFTLGSGVQADNIFWIIEGSATSGVPADATISIGSSPAITFDGNIIAGDAFTMSAGSGGTGVLDGTINGCVFARNANTLAGQTDVGGCANTSAGGTGGTGGTVPEPGSMTLLGSGLIALVGLVRSRRARAF